MSYVDFFAGAAPQWGSTATVASNPQTGSCERRLHERRAIEHHPVVVVCSNGNLPAELLDLSVTGAKIRLLSGLCPNAGEEISMRLADGVERHGAVAWLEQHTIGVSLRRAEPRA